MTLISIIIPCYNHGAYIEEALDSINLNKFYIFFEVIIINDGSTDIFTIEKLKLLKSKGWNVIDQPNMGLGAARNRGIEFAKGKYILPLDSDNKLIPETFISALKIMDEDPTIDVIYTDAIYFGNKSGKWEVGNFEPVRLIYSNYIDACALIRKDVFLNLGGYYQCKNMLMGHEDWALWLSLIFNKGKFYYFKKEGFYYRVLDNSMIRSNFKTKLENNRLYLFGKYSNLINKFEKKVENDYHLNKKEFRKIKNYKRNLFLKSLFLKVKSILK